jgi:hypothetical protein
MIPLRTPRHAIAIALLVILAAAYFVLEPSGQRLLTPPPSVYVPVIIVASLCSSLFCAWTLLGDLGSSFLERLAQRLGTILILAITIFTSAQASRGYYAQTAFSGPLVKTSEQWEIRPFSKGANTLSVSSALGARLIHLPASPEAIATVNGFGTCVTVQIESAADGARRIASTQAVITPAELSPCPASVMAAPPAAGFTSNQSESAEQQAANAAILEHNARLRSQDAFAGAEGAAEEEEREDGVSFEPGQPMIDVTPR